MLLSLLAAGALIATDGRTIVSDRLAAVRLIVLSGTTEYRLTAAHPYCSIWIALQAGISTSSASGKRQTIESGSFGLMKSDEVAQFTASPGSRQLVIVDFRSLRQPPTVDSYILAGMQELDDASSRNKTMLVAVSPVKLDDSWSVSDEAGWEPDRQQIIVLRPGGVSWLPSGIHHIRSLLDRACRFITIEW